MASDTNRSAKVFLIVLSTVIAISLAIGLVILLSWLGMFDVVVDG